MWSNGSNRNEKFLKIQLLDSTNILEYNGSNEIALFSFLFIIEDYR